MLLHQQSYVSSSGSRPFEIWKLRIRLVCCRHLIHNLIRILHLVAYTFQVNMVFYHHLCLINSSAFMHSMACIAQSMAQTGKARQQQGSSCQVGSQAQRTINTRLVYQVQLGMVNTSSNCVRTRLSTWECIKHQHMT